MKMSTSRLRRFHSLRTGQNRHTSSGQTVPPAALVMEAITTLLDGRPDAFQILLAHPPVASAQTRLSMTRGRAFIVCLSAHRSLSPRWFLVESLLPSSFAFWRDQTRQARRLRHLISSFRSSPRSSLRS